ncbi:TolC family protein [Limnohabitans sp. DM1]|uniref:TolC family protein n=1 Tax=Limnohabitans sp. DM1 TaxID=1597955 RepID=UPI000AAA08E9|nr:TolC family protein [Limnohabitans sp. DM1]
MKRPDRFWPLVLSLSASTWLPLHAQTAAAPHAALHGPSVGAWRAALPPAEQVQRWLANHPQVRAAQAGIELATAQAQRLQAGPHEWTLKAGLQQRSAEGSVASLREHDLAIERGLRWPHKKAQDHQLGELLQSESQAARQDARHETSRGLLLDWFELLKARATAQRLNAQLALAEQQLAGVRQRVKAGEVAQLDLLAAQAEQARTQALASQASHRGQVLQRQWLTRYPELAAPDTAALPSPQPPDDDAPTWVDRIMDHNHELALAQLRAQTAQAHAERQQQERRADPLLGVRNANERNGAERVWGVYISLPIGGSARQAQAAIAQAEAEQARQRLTLTEREVRSKAQQVASTAFDTQTTWQQLQHASAQTRRSADLQWRAYTLGESSLADVLQARRLAQEDAQAAENAQLDALYSQARLQLDAHRLWPED